jgi:hypothetical protein
VPLLLANYCMLLQISSSLSFVAILSASLLYLLGIV